MAASRRKPKAAKAKPEQSLESWERRPTESAQAFQAFVVYRGQAPAERSIRKAARQLNKAGSLLGKWSTDHDWQQRVAAYDLEMDRLERAEEEQARLDARRRHAQTIQGHLQVGASVAASVLRDIQDNPQLLDRMTFRERVSLAVAWARVAPRLIVSERLVRGESTENVAGHDGGPLEGERERVRRMSDADREEYLTGRLGAEVVHLGRAREAKENGKVAGDVGGGSNNGQSAT